MFVHARSNRNEPVYAVPVGALLPPEDCLEEGIRLHDRSVAGDKEATRKAHELLKAAYEAQPDNPLVQAYFGSATALMGRDAVDPNERFAEALRGVRILDEAVRRAPDNVQIRLLRGYVCLRLPEGFFQRSHVAAEDFLYVVRLYERDRDRLPEGLYWQALFELGTAYRNMGNLGEAVTTWKKLLEVARDPKYADLVRKEGVDPHPFDPLAAEQEEDAGPEPADPPELVEAIELHHRAGGWDPEAARQAVERLSDLARRNPDDVVTAAYLASARSLSSKYAGDPSAMFEQAISAMRALDRLVAQNRTNLRLRRIRAEHSLRLPEPFFHRTVTAILDLEYVAARCARNPRLLPAPAVHEVWRDLALCYERLRMPPEARAAWEKLLGANPEPALRAQAEAALRRYAAVPPEYRGTSRLEYAIYLHDLALAGDTEAAQRAVALLTDICREEPANALAQAYLGSATGLLGRDAADPGAMFTRAIQALTLLKKAVALDDKDPRIRLLRGYLCYSLPEAFFHLTPQAIADFRLVKAAYERGSRQVTAQVYQQVLHDLGWAYQRSGETEKARKVWEKLLKVSSDPRFRSLPGMSEVNEE